MRVAYVLHTCLALAVSVHAHHEGDGHHHAAPQFKPTSVKGAFVEQFTDDWESRWTPSSAKKLDATNIQDEELLRYKGKWAVESPAVVSIEGDKGLVAKDAAAHHAISAKFATPIDPAGKPLVIQYEVKTQNGLDCGGAYMKLLTYDEKFTPENFSDKTPYTIMFGPDRCAGNDKVHFIFRHQNPKTDEWEEKHLKSPLAGVKDKKTNLYTLIVHPDNKFEIRINNEKKKKTGSLLEDFSPAVNPPKEIDDPEDKKPADWEDRPTIADPDATKPADWDENAPMYIPDEDAKQPADWLADEPSTIPDPEAKKPEDWDDEEDGAWQAPTVPNPKCAKASGCGKWTRPTKKNPAYKGIWKAPMVKNPAYKGDWAPRRIANPNYFEDKAPANFNKIGAIGFEIWTMQDQILFDNIYIGHSIKEAEALAQESWAVKHKIESHIEEAEKPKHAPAESTKEGVAQIIDQIKSEVLTFINRAKESPVDAVKELPHVAGPLAALVAIPVLVALLLGGGSSAPAPKKKGGAKKVVESTPVVKEKVVMKNGKLEEEVEVSEEEEVVEEVETDGVKAQRRRARAKDEDDE
ncbi:hypothetical protein HK097_001132 [Rhizophlyctis rosea]|uniref:Calnexin n=1 Tax=Rhizophlyctis rosea TaxID=64517 RepID=A0AAD5WZ34_9FUNG|nr:hypothetical protein HK097_001132 [Rhizophlyctis rosea]